jgi:hypothetical protein
MHLIILQNLRKIFWVNENLICGGVARHHLLPIITNYPSLSNCHYRNPPICQPMRRTRLPVSRLLHLFPLRITYTFCLYDAKRFVPLYIYIYMYIYNLALFCTPFLCTPFPYFPFPPFSTIPFPYYFFFPLYLYDMSTLSPFYLSPFPYTYLLYVHLYLHIYVLILFGCCIYLARTAIFYWTFPLFLFPIYTKICTYYTYIYNLPLSPTPYTYLFFVPVYVVVICSYICTYNMYINN